MTNFDKSAFWVEIKFIHNDKESLFCSYINDLTGDRLSWFNNECATINDSVSAIKKIVNNIKKAGKVISIEGKGI